MGILSKIMTAIRGGAREAGEAIIDANSIRIFEQEVKDAEASLQKAKQDLTAVMAKEMQAKRQVESITTEIGKHEGYVAQALEKNDETLALEVAEKITQLQSELDIQQASQKSFSAHVERLKDMVKKTMRSLADMKRQLVMVKTTENVQKAAKSINSSYASSGSKLLSAKESLDRIKKRQETFEDKLKAGESLQDDLEGANLEKKLKAAGIGETSSSAADVLAKIKAKQNK